jgi:hypothetical protein
LLYDRIKTLESQVFDEKNEKEKFQREYIEIIAEKTRQVALLESQVQGTIEGKKSLKLKYDLLVIDNEKNLKYNEELKNLDTTPLIT